MKKFAVLFLSVAILFCSVVSDVAINNYGFYIEFFDGSGYVLEF